MELLPDDFYKMSWREFFLLVRGRRKKEDTDYLKQSLLTREIAYQVYCTIPLKKGKRHVGKKRYWPHPWDKEDDQKEFESMKNAMEALRAKATQNSN